MNDEGFIEMSLNNSNSFHKKAMIQLDWYKKMVGTPVIVSRINQNSKYKKVFGSLYSSTFQEDNEKQEFKYRVVINRNDLMKLYQKQIDSLQFYDNSDTLKLGDLLTYTRNGQEFKFKITDVMVFTEGDNSFLNQYTISGLIENNI